MRSEPLEDARDHLDELADEAEHTGPILLSRPGRAGVVVVSAADWRQMEDLIAEEETEWWLRSERERAARGEAPGEGEEGPGLDAEEFRRRFAHLFTTSTSV